MEGLGQAGVGWADAGVRRKDRVAGLGGRPVLQLWLSQPVSRGMVRGRVLLRSVWQRGGMYMSKQC
mgnify:CR=1 FL=1